MYGVFLKSDKKLTFSNYEQIKNLSMFKYWYTAWSEKR